ncbi:hypothetical protein Ancab_021744 [Ancistrocladus abbreviatus]
MGRYKTDLKEGQTRSAGMDSEGQDDDVVGYKTELQIAQIENDADDKEAYSKSSKSPRTKWNFSKLVGTLTESQDDAEDNLLKSPERGSRTEYY